MDQNRDTSQDTRSNLAFYAGLVAGFGLKTVLDFLMVHMLTNRYRQHLESMWHKATEKGANEEL